ncbi:MAG TPA: MarR family EPS-associated transcriptional regulator [Thermoanaerobaculia bacterium]|nr:MarR family EPS-associated transcriptional regulator [Thermoanaerobaculia bacterium]
MPELSDEVRYKLLKLLETEPAFSQRQLAERLGISVGKANYCLRALVQKGFVKVRNFRSSQNKQTYSYLLTPKGIEEKAKVTVRFLQFKIREFEALRSEIERLRMDENAVNESRSAR